MPSRCCEDPRPDLILSLEGDPSGHFWVGACRSCRGALIQRHSFDDWDPSAHEEWSMYWWWRMDEADTAAFREAIAACPAPLDETCGCPVHAGLRAAKPRPLPPSTETPYDAAEVPRTRFTAGPDGRVRWSEV
ncbi:hypothetical protein [Actinomadura algeriensis]|uniref:Uncharacterized protein n=1 Tax=Actinomadura algeriensis TaxID=1679523 RepID=A0ABR9JXK9_9ACTN|nr:hypothetical protein [Actinomadura algeriensis]MBE1535310.1 hypothetical protein [Actinomadura algeriensis]